MIDKLPLLRLIGREIVIESSAPVDVDQDTRLVCQYLKASIDPHPKDKSRKMIDIIRLENNRESANAAILKLSISDEQCHDVLEKIWKEKTPNMKRKRVHEKTFVQYMVRRIRFLQVGNYNNVQSWLIMYRAALDLPTMKLIQDLAVC